MSKQNIISEHRDDEASKTGMWIFIFSELLLFGGLFITYSVYRFLNPEAFKMAADNLSVLLGTVNTVILLVSSMTIAMAVSAIQYKNKKLTLALLAITILLAIVFMVNKYFEWTGKISHGIFPGSDILSQSSHGEILFYGLYYSMTGLHGIHIIIGIAFIGYVMWMVKTDEIKHDDFITLENSALYWHLVDLIWIFLFPLFYLIT